MTCSVQVSFLNPTLLGLLEVYQSAAGNGIPEPWHAGCPFAPDGTADLYRCDELPVRKVFFQRPLRVRDSRSTHSPVVHLMSVSPVPPRA